MRAWESPEIPLAARPGVGAAGWKKAVAGPVPSAGPEEIGDLLSRAVAAFTAL